jgi:ribonuclease P protein component
LELAGRILSEQDQSFPKQCRLRRQGEFDRVHDSQFFAADATLVVKAVENGSGITRLGLSVSRRVGNAVVRNRWKRRLREAFRKQKHEMPVGLDLVVRPRKGAVCNYQQISRSLVQLSRRLDRRIHRSSN